MKTLIKYLEKNQQLAEYCAEPPGASNVPEYCEGQAEQQHQKVGKGQVDEEDIRGCPHDPISSHREHDQPIPNEPHGEQNAKYGQRGPLEWLGPKNCHQVLFKLLIGHGSDLISIGHCRGRVIRKWNG